MPLFAKFDVTFPDDPKVIEAGDIAELVYLRCVLRCKAHGSDGVIHRRRLARWLVGIRGNHEHHMATLVNVGLLCLHPDGWCIPPNAWGKWNLTASEVEEKRKKKAEAAAKGNHERWHVNGKRSDSCVHCIAEPSQTASQVRDIWDDEESLEIELELQQPSATDDPLMTEALRRVEVLVVCGKKLHDRAAYTASVYEALRSTGWTPTLEAVDCDDPDCDAGFINHADKSVSACPNCNPWLVNA